MKNDVAGMIVWNVINNNVPCSLFCSTNVETLLSITTAIITASRRLRISFNPLLAASLPSR